MIMSTPRPSVRPPPPPSAKTVSVYGMQYREKSIAKSLSKISLTDLDIAGQAKYMEEAAGAEAVVVTWPLVSAVLAAVLLEFLVGFNIGVMVREGTGG